MLSWKIPRLYFHWSMSSGEGFHLWWPFRLPGRSVMTAITLFYRFFFSSFFFVKSVSWSLVTDVIHITGSWTPLTRIWNAKIPLHQNTVTVSKDRLFHMFLKRTKICVVYIYIGIVTYLLQLFLDFFRLSSSQSISIGVHVWLYNNDSKQKPKNTH